MEPTSRYTAVCLQTSVHVVDEHDPDPKHAEKQINKNLDRQCELIDWLFLDQRLGGPKLITFSEFCMTGVPESRTLEDYLSRTVYLPGWVTERLGAKAKEYDCYIACNTFERDDDFPGTLFNTSFLVGPDGNLALRYRKNNSSQGGTVKNSNPGDIYDDYTRISGGPESLFPVADTPIGRIALITCFDVRFPEVMRCMALRGAEVVVHLTAEPHASRGPWTESKQVRAWDNQVYLLACNNGDTLNSKRPINRQWGGSRIIDFTGRILAEAPAPGETVVQAQIDLEALRVARAAGNRNILATNRYWMYADYFEDPDKQTWPLNSFTVDRPYQTSGQMQTIGKAVLEKLYDRGTFVRPEQETASNGKKYLKRYGVVCLQTDVHGMRNSEISEGKNEENARRALERNCELIDWACEEPRYGPKLVVLSEFHLTGVPETRTLRDYRAMALELPGIVGEYYGKKAKQRGVYIAGGIFEKDEQAWPGRVFNTAFLISPDGEIILRYRKNNDYQIGTPCNTNSGDLYRAYIERYGSKDAFFPVVDTELGRIGLMICYDIRFAEVPRMLALNGAEIILHPTAESGGGIATQAWQLAKQTRAYDNACYFVSVNNGDTVGSSRPRNRQRAFSTKIIDFEGNILAEAENNGEAVIQSQIDLEALRRYRSAANRVPIITSRFGTYAPIYRTFDGWPKDLFADRCLESNQEPLAVAKEVMEKLYDRGILVRPGVRGAEPAVLLRD